MVYLRHIFKLQLNCKLNICFVCGLLCFASAELFWLFVLAVCPFFFFKSYGFLTLLRWHCDSMSTECLQCNCVHLDSSVVVSTSSCIPSGHISSRWGLHPAGSSVFRIHTHTHTPHSHCPHFRERDKPQTATDDKATAKAGRTVKAKLAEAEARISSKHYSSYFYSLMYPVLLMSGFLHLLSIYSMNIKQWLHLKMDKQP